jgi:hypothetical protein
VKRLDNNHLRNRPKIGSRAEKVARRQVLHLLRMASDAEVCYELRSNRFGKAAAMRQNSFGELWPVSALTLGGGGIGTVWGETTFDECVATVNEAVGAGISLIDLAPS